MRARRERGASEKESAVTATRSLSDIITAGPTRPAKLSHIVVRTAQLAKLRAWYLTLLAARVAYENEQLCFMTYDDEHHRLGIVQLPGVAAVAPDAMPPGLEHVSFTYDDLGQLLANYQRLKTLGIEPFWTINHGPTISMYYRDPDGNKVELQVDVFTTAEETNAFLEKFYPENFMGIIFDPEEMIRKYEAGVPIADLLRRPPLPAGMTPWDMHRP
jgi:catechol 2,3-dioxygenase-like lactoylglutathione lyase family enzyme